MRRTIHAAGGLLVLGLHLLLMVGTARAEHEVYYRYTILGYVKDAVGQPISTVEVELIRDRTGFSYLGETDENGLYILVARLGDESIGETLTLRIGEARISVTVRFEPQNHEDERGTRIDLTGGRWVERTSYFRSTLVQILETGSR